jgi:WD40 repeat protein
VYPILDAKCVACHNVAVDESKLILEDVEGILKGGKRGPAVVAKKPDESLMFQLASHTKKPAMPPQPNSIEAEPLTPRELGIIKQWILEGAQAGSGSAKMVVNWSPVPANIHSSYALALSPHSRMAAVGRANQIHVYDLATQELIARLNDPLLADLKFNEQPMYPDGAAHQDFVHALAFHPSGNLLASGGYRVIKLWERPQNALHWESPPLSGEVTVTAVSADKKFTAAGTSDHKVVLYDNATGKVVREFAGATGTVTGLAFTPDGTQLLGGGHDKKVIAWNVADAAVAAELVTPVEIESLALNKDGNRLITGHRDNIIRVWELPGVAKPAEGETEIKPLAELKGHGKPVKQLLAHPTDGNQCVSCSEDGTARLWRLDNGQNLRSINHGAAVNAVAISADANWLVTAGADGYARVWQTSNGQKKTEVKGKISTHHDLVIKTEAVSVAKQKVSLADAAVKADEKSVNDRTEALKKAKEALTEAEKKLKEAQDKVKKAEEAYNAAKKAFEAKKDDKGLEKKFKDAETALNKEKDELKKAEEAHKVADNAVKLSDQSLKNAQASLEERKKTLAAAQKHQADTEAALKTSTDADNASVKPLLSAAFAPDGKTFAVGSEDGFVTTWKTEDGRGLDTYQQQAASPVTTLQYIAADSLISGGKDKLLHNWNLQPTWKLVARLGPPADKPLDVADSGCEDRIASLAFSPDGTMLASGGGEPSRNGELIIWDVAKRSLKKKVEEAHSDTVLGVEFSYDNKYLLSGAADKFAKLFNVETGELIRAFEGHTHHVMDVSMKKDQSELVTAGADNAIKIWNTETGEQKRTITNYAKQVTSIEYQGDTNNVLSCGGDKSVRFHQTSNGRQVRSYGGADEYQYASAISRDGNVVLSAGDDGVLLLWNGTNGQSLGKLEPPASPGTQQVSVEK